MKILHYLVVAIKAFLLLFIFLIIGYFVFWTILIVIDAITTGETRNLVTWGIPLMFGIAAVFYCLRAVFIAYILWIVAFLLLYIAI